MTEASISFNLVESNGNAHLHIANMPHDTETLDCWCLPSFYRVCDCDDGCWKCENGKHVITRDEAEWESDPMLVVHNV